MAWRDKIYKAFDPAGKVIRHVDDLEESSGKVLPPQDPDQQRVYRDLIESARRGGPTVRSK